MICFFSQHIGSGASVIASFQQTLWTVVPICSGAVRQKTLGKGCHHVVLVQLTVLNCKEKIIFYVKSLGILDHE